MIVMLAVALSGCGTTSSPKGDPAPYESLTVTSAAFTDGAKIPDQFTCTGAGDVPSISWTGDLHGATAFAVVVDDPDAPGGTFTHWVVLDLPASATSLSATVPAGAHQAANSEGAPKWTPPCPPSGTHHYRFTVYGLTTPTGLPDATPTTKALSAIHAKAVVTGRLTGLVSG